ncbi:MFS transporter [Rhodanobacter glycinis]|uniref:MFS transporter n=1 Tax=Rhodanobacter glycinis TaxID=582702 RepID=A0A5B9DUS6_9GAMM|nr:MFS transporter [Rhodanobacter glycinis]QEE23393.1 MFS transporter [Rhodanobacter glycinis]
MTRPPVNPAPAVTWRTHISLVLLSLVYIFSYIDRQVIAVVIEPIEREFGLSDAAMGVLSGLAFGVMYAALGIPVGRFADKHTRSKVVAICASLWSLATMACGVAMNFWQLLLARMSVAVGEAGGMAPSISLISDMYPKKNRAMAISVFMVGPQLGLLIGLALGGWIAQHYGWRHTFIWMGAPGLVLGLLVWLLVREPQRGRYDDIATPATTAAPAESLLAQLVRLLRIVALRRVAIAISLAGIAAYAYGVWVPTFLIRTHGLSLAQAGMWFGLASGIGATVGTVTGGALCDRLARRDRRWQIGMPMLGMLVSVPAAVAFLLWPTGGHVVVGGVQIPQVMLFAAVFGFFASWWPPLLFNAVSNMVGAGERSVAAALLNFFLTLFGAGLGPLLAGVISDLLTPSLGEQALRWSLLGIMGLFVVGALFLVAAIKPYRAHLAAMRDISAA